jgi:hypothetical protein
MVGRRVILLPVMNQLNLYRGIYDENGNLFYEGHRFFWIKVHIKYLGKIEINNEPKDIYLVLEQKQKDDGSKIEIERYCTEDGEVLTAVIKRAINLLDTCECSPSCYRCLRNYENQKIHEILDRENALNFLKQLV